MLCYSLGMERYFFFVGIGLLCILVSIGFRMYLMLLLML